MEIYLRWLAFSRISESNHDMPLHMHLMHDICPHMVLAKLTEMCVITIFVFCATVEPENRLSQDAAF